jgi:hypothetical protein
MSFDEFPLPVQNRNILSASYPLEENYQQKSEGLTTKIRQRINTASKRVQASGHRKFSTPNLTNLTSESQVRRKEFFFEKKKTKFSSIIFRNLFYIQLKELKMKIVHRC